MRRLVVWLSLIEHNTYGDNQECFMVEKAIKPTFIIGLLMVLISVFIAITKNVDISILAGLVLLLILIWRLRKSRLNWLRSVTKAEFDSNKLMNQKFNFIRYPFAILITLLISLINMFIGIVFLGSSLVYFN